MHKETVRLNGWVYIYCWLIFSVIYYPRLPQSQPAVIHIHKIPTENTGDNASRSAGSQSQIDLLFGDSLYLCFHSHFFLCNHSKANPTHIYTWNKDNTCVFKSYKFHESCTTTYFIIKIYQMTLCVVKEKPQISPVMCTLAEPFYCLSACCFSSMLGNASVLVQPLCINQLYL